MPDTVDGVSLNVGDRVLVKGQSANIDPNNSYSKENGIYVVVTLGSGGNGVWDRASDHNTNNQVSSGNTVHVDEGLIHKDEIWRLVTDDPINVENGLANQTGQQWERIATFGITDGPWCLGTTWTKE